MEDPSKDIDFLFEMYHKGLSIKDVSNWEGEGSKFAKGQLLTKKLDNMGEEGVKNSYYLLTLTTLLKTKKYLVKIHPYFVSLSFIREMVMK